MQQTLTRPATPWRSFLASLVRALSTRPVVPAAHIDSGIKMTDQWERELADREFNRWR